jgi:hypothetical protein
MAEAVMLLSAVQALKLADFSKEEAESRTKQNTLSKRRRKAEYAFGKENKRRGVQECRARHRTQSNPLASIDVQSVSNLSGLTEDKAQETDAVISSAASSIKNSTTRRAVRMPSTVSSTNARNVSLPFDHRKGIMRKSRRTPQQNTVFEAEHKIAFKAKNVAYSWAVEKSELKLKRCGL